MGYYRDPGGTYYYNRLGSNTMFQISATPINVFDIDLTNLGTSVGYAQFYMNGTQAAAGSAGTPDFVYIVAPNAQQGTTGWRDLDFTIGRQCNPGLSCLWSNAETGTTAHNANLRINVTYVGTQI